MVGCLKNRYNYRRRILDRPSLTGQINHMASKSAPKPPPEPASAAKTAVMGAVAVIAIILSLVVAWKTFKDPSADNVGKPPTELISGVWKKKADAATMSPPPGAPTDFMIAKDLASFDATGAEGGSVVLTMADGKTQTTKVMSSQPGNLIVEVKLPNGRTSQMTIAQMGDGGPLMVHDGITTMTFEKAP